MLDWPSLLKVKIFFSPILPVFRKTVAFWKVLRLRSLILLVRAIFRIRWISSICWMILWGANRSRSTVRKLSQCHFVPLRTAWIYIQWNFLGQTAESRCEVFPTFRQLTLSPSSGCADGLVVVETSENLQWRCCLPEKISLNSVVAKASRLTWICTVYKNLVHIRQEHSSSIRKTNR